MLDVATVWQDDLAADPGECRHKRHTERSGRSEDGHHGTIERRPITGTSFQRVGLRVRKLLVVLRNQLLDLGRKASCGNGGCSRGGESIRSIEPASGDISLALLWSYH